LHGVLALSAIVLLGGAVVAAQDWPKFHNDLAQLGYTIAKAPPTNHVLWTFNTGAPVYASPVVVGRSVFVGSVNGNMYSLDKYTGALKWTYATQSAIHSTAAVAWGMVYFLAENGVVYALNADTGALVWSAPIGNGPWDWSSPAVSGTYVFVASSAGSLTKLDAATGAVQWVTLVGGSANSMIAVAGGKVYTGTHNFNAASATLVAVDEVTGAIVWQYDYHLWHAGVFGMLNCNGVAVADGDVDTALEVYFGVYNWGGIGPQLVGLQEGLGTEEWALSIGGNSTSTPAFHNGRLFIGSDDWNLYAVNSTDQTIAWTFPTGAPIWASPAVSGDGAVCFGSLDHTVYCVDEATGALRWSYYTGASRLHSSPAISDAMLFIGNENGNVYAFSSMPVPVDIKPTSCPNPLNVRSKGVVSVAIAGTADLDVLTIDPASVRLEGVPPLRWSRDDVTLPYLPLLGKLDRLDCSTEGADGYLDLVFKFDTEALVGALGPVADGQVLVLQLTGSLKPEFGGTAIRGEDVVVIIKKK
jgi:outer membrane protein assembly factor BamB